MAYVIEVYRPGLTSGSAAILVEQVRDAIEHHGQADGSLRYVGSTVTPADEVCYLRLESTDRARVDALVARLGLTDARVSEVVELG